MQNLTEPIRNKEDILKIREYLNPLYSLIWTVGTNTGLRISDILNLKINIVNKDYIELIEQKTQKYKKFPIKPQIKELIKEYWINIRSKQNTKDDEQYFFISRKHQKLTSVSVYRVIKQACNDLNIKGNFGTHTMRKTFGYHHYKQFNDVVLLQKIFNHSSPAITLRYIGITQEEIEDSYNKFNIDVIEKNNKNIIKYWDIKDINPEALQQLNEKLDNALKKIENVLNLTMKLYGNSVRYLYK